MTLSCPCRVQYAIQMMMSKGVHARDEDSNACSDRSANWQVAVRLRGRRNEALRVENAAVDLKIRPRTGSKSQAFTSASLRMLMRAHARDGNSKAYSDRSANWQIAVRLSGRRNAVLRVVNAAVVVEIDPPVLLLHAHVSMVAFR